MTVHYQNANGEEKFIKNVLHLQNIDNDEWAALLADGKTELTLLTARIEAVIDDRLNAATADYDLEPIIRPFRD